MTPVGPATITDALLLLVFCDICSSSVSLSFESLDSILISNCHYYIQDGRPTRYSNHRYKPYNIYDYNRRTWQDHRHHIYRCKATAASIWFETWGSWTRVKKFRFSRKIS